MNHLVTVMLNLNKIMVATGVDSQSTLDFFENIEAVCSDIERLGQHNDLASTMMKSLNDAANRLLGDDETSSKFSISSN